jgi:hypothetical protein
LAFVGIGSLTGLNSEAFALPPSTLPFSPTPRVSDFRLGRSPRDGDSMGARINSVPRLPFSAIVLTLVITGAGVGVAPLIIVAVVVACITTVALAAREEGGSRRGPLPT